jgi:hypothetical protein
MLLNCILIFLGLIPRYSVILDLTERYAVFQTYAAVSGLLFYIISFGHSVITFNKLAISPPSIISGVSI